MNRSSGFSEDELHAFVDGQLDGPRREAFLLQLKEAPEAAARAENWRSQNEAIRMAFARVESEPVPLSLTLAANVHPLSSPFSADDIPLRLKGLIQAAWPLLIFLMGGLSVLLVGILVNVSISGSGIKFHGMESLGSMQRSEQAAFLTRAKITYASLATPAVETKNAKIPASLLSSRTGLLLPHLSEEGLGPAGVKILPGLSGALACLVYGKAENGPLALCAEELNSQESFSSVHESEMQEGATTILYWRQRRAHYALLGAQPAAFLRRLAGQVHAEIASFGEE